MNVELSPAAERALTLAGRLAASANRPVIEPSHIVAALLDEQDGQAMASAIASGMSSWPTGLDLPQLANLCPVTAYGDRSSAGLRRARRYAREHFVDRTVTTELLLLALVQSDPATADELARYGLDVTRLADLVLGPAIAPVPVEMPCGEQKPLLFDMARGECETDWPAIARVLDAAANRAREALRVLEDYARLVLDDACMTRSFKFIRHRLAKALDEENPAALLTARDVRHDVGTSIGTASEYERSGIADVVVANTKRLQEALRSLEEFSKTRNSATARAVEAIRYETYSLEQALIVGIAAQRQLADVRLYWLTPPGCPTADLTRQLRESIAGGVQMVQLRDKGLSDRELMERARLARQVTRTAGIPLIINDRCDVAAAVGADGVHLGQDDLSIADARRVLPPRALVGVSTHTLDQVRRAVHEGASYIGVGPTFASSTKSFREFAGLPFVSAASRETSLPAFVLGGVTAANVAAIVAAGGRRIAVTAAVSADDPRGSAALLRRAVDSAFRVP